MEKRARQWRRCQAAQVFKARLKYQASINMDCFEDGIVVYHPTWNDVAETHWTQIYRATGMPCSCWLYRGESYNRLDAKRKVSRILKEEDM